MTLGFIILRCVWKTEDNILWQTCYQSIRKFYTNPILIVDDNCKEGLLDTNFPMIDVQIVQSEKDMIGAAEILPYYFFHLLHPFDIAVVVHDSMFFRCYYDFENYPLTDVVFLWEFGYFPDCPEKETELILQTKKSEDTMKLYLSKQWSGCNGAASMVTWNFVDQMDSQLGVFSCIPLLRKQRKYRNGFERVYSVLCHQLSEKITHNRSLFGRLFCPTGSYGNSISSVEQYKGSCPIFKVQRGR